MQRLIALLIVGMALGPVQAAERFFAPVAMDNQEVKYLDGTPHLIAKGAGGGLVVAFEPQSKKRAWITVFMANTGPAAFSIKETDVTAVGGDGQPLHVYSYSELQKQQSRSEMWGAIAAGLAGASRGMAAANAGNSYQYGTYNSTTQAQAWGSSGYASGTAQTQGAYSGYSYNGAAAFQAQQQANAQNAADAARMRQTNALNRASLESRALKANTVEPGANLVGQVNMDLPKAKRGVTASFGVSVPVGSETIVVRFVEELR